MHLQHNSPDYRGMITCDITVELRLRECYQAMPLEAISEEDWYTDVDRNNNVSTGK